MRVCCLLRGMAFLQRASREKPSFHAWPAAPSLSRQKAGRPGHCLSRFAQQCMGQQGVGGMDGGREGLGKRRQQGLLACPARPSLPIACLAERVEGSSMYKVLDRERFWRPEIAFLPCPLPFVVMHVKNVCCCLPPAQRCLVFLELCRMPCMLSQGMPCLPVVRKVLNVLPFCAYTCHQHTR